MEVSLRTDAAGSRGFGAILGTQWCADEWPAEWPAEWRESGLCWNFTFLELLPIVVAMELWGPGLRNRRICFHTDNMGVVHSINSLTSASLPVLALLQHLVLRCLEHNV